MLDAKWTNGSGWGPAVGERFVHDCATFGTLIRHEKSRADRDGDGFSLVIVEIRGTGVSNSHRRVLADHMLSQLRQVDTIGWIDNQRLGIILPDTTKEGARQLTERVMEKEGGWRLPFEVYRYPWSLVPIGSGETAEIVPDCENGGDEGSSPVLPPIFCIPLPAWKRSLDIFGALAGLVLLWPLFLLTALYIKIVSPGPILFRQKRVGQGGKVFTFVKFRTMKTGNNEAYHKSHIVERLRFNEPLEKLDDKGDPRIIPGGRILRRTCIDELPQIFNVLHGDMSLVGPRPCLSYEAAEFLRWHGQRFDVVPGLTGLWQVSGKNKLCLLEMIRLDISYANNMSPGLDLKIIFLTIPAIVRMVMESVAKRLKRKSR